MITETNFGPIRIIPGKNKGRYPYCNSIYIEDSGILIDPGCDYKRLKEIRDNEGVSCIWMTHWHEDHFKCIDLFHDIPLWVPRKDAPPFTHIDTFFEWYGYNEKGNKELRDQWTPILKKNFGYKERTPDRLLDDGDIIELENVTVEVIHAPGHSLGHTTFFIKEEKILFLGDYDLSSFGPFYGDMYSSIIDIRKSIEKLKNIDAKIWLSSHENGIFEKNPGELWDNYLNVINEREKRLINFLEKPKTMDEITNAWLVYGKVMESVYMPIEYFSMKKHLQILIDNKIAEYKDGKFNLM